MDDAFDQKLDVESNPLARKKEEKKKADESVHSQLTSSLMAESGSEVDEKEAKKDKDKKKKALTEA